MNPKARRNTYLYCVTQCWETRLPCRWTSSQRSFSSSRLAAEMVQGMITLVVCTAHGWDLGMTSNTLACFQGESCDWDLRGNVQGGKKKTKLITANLLDVVTQSHRRHHRITINQIAINYTCSSWTKVETPALAVVMPLILRGLKDRDERSCHRSTQNVGF